MATTPKDSINLMRGWPNPALLPVALIQSAAQKALSDLAIAQPGLLYGPDPGYEPLREALADWLTDFYQPSSPTTLPATATASRIAITGGASQSLGCMLSVFTDPEYTRNVWIVAPAYYLAFRIFEDAGLGRKMRAIPEDEEGLDIEALRGEIKKSEDGARRRGVDGPVYKSKERKGAKVYKHVIYCVPTFANPSSGTMSLRRREELVRLAREFDGLVVSDDVYDFLQWPATDATASAETVQRTAHLPRLVDVDRSLDGGAERDDADGFGNACSNGSFSKIAGPGIRVGWVEGTEKLTYGVSQTGTTASGGAPSQLTSTYITLLLTSGALQNHIAFVLQPAYAARYAIMTRAIEIHLLPLGFALPQPTRDVVGGYFTWLSIPAPLTATSLVQRCREEANVVLAPGTIFEVPGQEGCFGANVRLCWAWEDEWKLEEGVKRMAEVAARMLEEGTGSEDGEEYVVVGGEGDVGELK